MKIQMIAGVTCTLSLLCAITASAATCDSLAALALKDTTVTMAQVVQPGQFLFRCGSTVAAAHKVGKEITNMKE